MQPSAYCNEEDKPTPPRTLGPQRLALRMVVAGCEVWRTPRVPRSGRHAPFFWRVHGHFFVREHQTSVCSRTNERKWTNLPGFRRFGCVLCCFRVREHRQTKNRFVFTNKEGIFRFVHRTPVASFRALRPLRRHLALCPVAPVLSCLSVAQLPLLGRTLWSVSSVRCTPAARRCCAVAAFVNSVKRGQR